MKKGFVLALALLVCFCGADRKAEVRVASQTQLSDHGSTRATAYSMSNKIITAKGVKYVTWLDSVSNIMIQSLHLETGKWGEPLLLGRGVDNHSGAALTMDSKGYIYAVFGPHHGPFQFARSLEPYSIGDWKRYEDFGEFATYPSLVCDANDVLHLTYRGGPMPRRLMYQQKETGEKWSAAKALVFDDVGDTYTQFGNPLAVSSKGVLHLGFHIYDFFPRAGNYIGYLQSPDGGTTWRTAAGDTVNIPATTDTDCFIEKGEKLDMRLLSLVLDQQQRPWLSALHLEKQNRGSILYYLDNRQWRAIDLTPLLRKVLPQKEILYTSITFDKENRLYVAAAIQDTSIAAHWGDPNQEVVLMFSSDQGRSFQVIPVSKTDSTQSNWLPNIERPYSHRPISVPALLHTQGGPGTGLVDFVPTKVFFTRLKVDE